MTDFVIRVVIDPGPARRGTDKVKKQLSGVESSANRLRRTLQRTFAFVGIAAGIRQLARLSDTFIEVQNRLKFVTESEEELIDVTEKLFKVSRETRTSFESTAIIYSRTALAAKELGRSQDELIKFSRVLNQATILSGATQIEAQNAFIQLSQAIASGVLRGRELRSVLEQLPVVAGLIADKLGVTRGELRKLGEEGKLSANLVIDSLLEASESIEESFAETVPTISQSFTVLNSEIIKVVGSVNDATGAANLFAGGILLASQNVELLGAGLLVIGVSALPALASGFGAFLSPTIAGAAVLAVTVSKIVDELIELQRESAELEQQGLGFDLESISGVENRISRLRNRLIDVQGKILDVVESGGDPNDKLQSRAKNLQGDLRILERLLSEIQQGSNVSAAGIGKLTKAFDDSIKNIEKENQLLFLNAKARDVQAKVLREVARIEKDTEAKVKPEERERLRLAFEGNRVLERRAELLDEIIEPQRRFAEDVEILSQAQVAGVISSQQHAEAVARLRTELEGAPDAAKDFAKSFAEILGAQDKVAENQRILANAFNGTSEALVQFRQSGVFNFRLLVNSIIDDIQRLIQKKIILAIVDAFTGGAAGAADRGLSGISGFFGGTAGGGGVQAAQFGGPIGRRQPVLVGEGGPELFIPQTAGRVAPAGETAALLRPQQAAAPAAAAPQITINNLLDPGDIVSAGLSTAQGSEAFLNQVVADRNDIGTTLGLDV